MLKIKKCMKKYVIRGKYLMYDNGYLFMEGEKRKNEIWR